MKLTSQEQSVGLKDSDILEGQKLAYDAFKHLTTLSSGTIVLMATFLKDLFPKPVLGYLVVWIFVSFIITVISSVIMMFVLSSAIISGGQLEGKIGESIAIFGITVSALSFFIGIIIFIVFAVKNFNF